jgi:hypothetical protein
LRDAESRAHGGLGPGLGSDGDHTFEVERPAFEQASKIQPLDQGEHQAVLE